MLPLGQVAFTSAAVSKRIRDTLTTESGLNDGLALPAIIFLACASVGLDHDLAQSSWVVYALKQIFVGILAVAL
ncbi:MAG: cation:proton antiporter, partial [Rhizobiaceae bacterium]